MANQKSCSDLASLKNLASQRPAESSMDKPQTLDVGAFVAEDGAMDDGVHALHSLLRFKGRSTTYAALKAISGDGFKFIYDKADVSEAMRDLTPTDFIRDGLAFFGLTGSWQTGYTLDELGPILKGAIEAGNPVLTSNLADSSLGYQLIVGFQEGTPPSVAVRAARNAEEVGGSSPSARWMTLDNEWDGPVSSRARWALNPIFVIDSEGSAKAPKHSIQLQHALAAGLRVFESFEVAYATSGFDEAYANEPTAGRSASSGLEAWAALADDVRDRPDLADFAFIWKVDTVGSRLRHDRSALAEFFESHIKREKGDRAKVLKSLSETLVDIARRAEELRTLVWNQATSHVQTPEDFQQLMASTRSIAYPVPEHRGFPERLREVGYEDRMHQTSWGKAIVMGDDVRWRHVARSVDDLGNLEADVETHLRRLSD